MIRLEAIGNLADNAKVVQPSNGEQFISFAVGCSERYKNKAGEVVERTTWIDCTMSYRENLVQYLAKGTKVFISGKPSTRCYMNRENQPASALQCHVFDLELCGSKNQANSTATEDDSEKPF